MVLLPVIMAHIVRAIDVIHIVHTIHIVRVAYMIYTICIIYKIHTLHTLCMIHMGCMLCTAQITKQSEHSRYNRYNTYNTYGIIYLPHIFAILIYVILAIVAMVGVAEPPLAAGGWLGGGFRASETGNPCPFSPQSTGLLRPDRLCRAATGSGRKSSRVRTTDRRHSQACRARPFCPIHSREGHGQNCLNSLGQFATFAAKLTQYTAPYFAQGHPGTPRRLRKQFGSHGIAAQICFRLLRPKGWPFGIPVTDKNNPGAQPWIIFILATDTTIENKYI